MPGQHLGIGTSCSKLLVLLMLSHMSKLLVL